MKYTGTIVLLLAFLVQTFSKTFIVAGYYANTAAYAKNCENKARPAMHCNGHCQMMKKLQQEENKEKQNSERKASGKEEILSSKSFYTTVNCQLACMVIPYAEWLHRKVKTMPRSVFHPPAAIV